MRKPLLAWSFILAALLGAGCLVPRGGLPGSSQGGGGGTTGSSSAIGGAGGIDPGTGASTTVTTGVSASASVGATSSTGCASTTEICDDGIDNDCDGQIDCADQDCTGPADGFQCAPQTPSGWTVVARVDDGSAPCPTGYDSPAVVASAPAAGGQSCSCSCGAPATNPCTQGSLSIMFGIMGCGAATIPGVATGACDALGSTVPFSGGNTLATAKSTALAPKVVACGAIATLPPSPPITAVTCAPAVLSGGGCAGQAACVPKVAAANRLCIQHPGDVACPSGGPGTRSVVAAPVDVVDARTCAQCSCTSTATQCTGAKFTGYDDANCTVHAATANVDGSCNFAVNGQNFTGNTHFVYSATPSTMVCAPASGTTPVNGSFTLNNPVTLCCEP